MCSNGGGAYFKMGIIIACSSGWEWSSREGISDDSGESW